MTRESRTTRTIPKAALAIPPVLVAAACLLFAGYEFEPVQDVRPGAPVVSGARSSPELDIGTPPWIEEGSSADRGSRPGADAGAVPPAGRATRASAGSTEAPRPRAQVARTRRRPSGDPRRRFP